MAAGGAAMLVPDPKEDVKAQIGDKAADEISDLSELESEAGDDACLELLHRKRDHVNNRLLNKHLIGGHNSKILLDELINDEDDRPLNSATTSSLQSLNDAENLEKTANGQLQKVQSKEVLSTPDIVDEPTSDCETSDCQPLAG